MQSKVAEKLGSAHLPSHLLCKAHTVEALDQSNLRVLANLESKLQLRESFININPHLRSFYRGKSTVVVCGINALLKLITPDHSAKAVSLSDEFDFLVEQSGTVKHISLYHERRFTNLGYAAASLLHAVDLLKTLLLETPANNLLVQACRMYLESEVFLTELSVLSYFTHKVTLPLLNCVSFGRQEYLLEKLPLLWKDLEKGDLSTLQEYEVLYKHVPVSAPSEAGFKLLKWMCTDAALTIERQCGREYGFGKHHGIKNRATNISKSDPTARQSMPTDNIIAEREFAKFDHVARVAKYRNKNFTAKGIRADMMIYKSSDEIVNKTMGAVEKILQNREKDWNINQKKIIFQNIKEKKEKKVHSNNYITKLLMKFKGWNGPVTSVEELQQVISLNPDNEEVIVRTEMSYYRQTHPNEVRSNPDLYKLQGKGIDHKQRLINLCLIHTDNLNKDTKNIDTILPTNVDLTKPLEIQASEQQHTEKVVHDKAGIQLNDLCATIWTNQNQTNWYIGYIIKKNQSSNFVVEYLQRITQQPDKWVYCDPPEILEVEEEQIMQTKPVGSWDLTSSRQTKLVITNHNEIQEEFDSIFC